MDPDGFLVFPYVCSFARDVNTKYNLWIAGTVVLQDTEQ